MRTAKKILLGIIIGIVGIFVIAIAWAAIWQHYYPEEYAEFKKEQERKERIEEQKLVAKELERERELAKYQEVYAENGRLKYRPYWLVGDGYKELEFTGKITRDSTCANLAEAANAENIFENFYLGLWLGGCVDNPGDDYKDILWKGSYLKYRLYWDQEDMHKNIDNRR